MTRMLDILEDLRGTVINMKELMELSMEQLGRNVLIGLMVSTCDAGGNSISVILIGIFYIMK